MLTGMQASEGYLYGWTGLVVSTEPTQRQHQCSGAIESRSQEQNILSMQNNYFNSPEKNLIGSIHVGFAGTGTTKAAKTVHKGTHGSKHKCEWRTVLSCSHTLLITWIFWFGKPHFDILL